MLSARAYSRLREEHWSKRQLRAAIDDRVHEGKQAAQRVREMLARAAQVFLGGSAVPSRTRKRRRPEGCRL
ncbi:MAG: hypothetical protein PVI30_18295 [Myxococcales bacterium]